MRLRSNGFYGGEMIVVYSMNEHAIYIQSVTAFVPPTTMPTFGSYRRQHVSIMSARVARVVSKS